MKKKIKNAKFMYKNSRGQLTILMIIMLVALLLTLIMLLVGGIAVVKINEALSMNISMGQVNLAEVNEDTFGKFTDMYVSSADWWGVSLIFGMIMGLFLSAYMLRNRLPKWGIILDIFIIIAMFIVSLYLSSTYSAVLDGMASAGETFLEDSVTTTSRFMLNLPIFVVIIGAVMMILFHSSIPRKSEENIQQGGFLQGV